jgi:hypothetical protein
VVVGVTNEPESLVTKHVQRVGMEFPVARVQGDSADGSYGIRAFPSAFLIDPRGRVVWAGHFTAELEDSVIEALFARQAYVPPLGDKRHAKIDAALAKREYGQAHAALEKALAEAPGDAALAGALASIQAGAKALAEDAAAAAQAGHYGFAAELHAETARLFDGLPQAEQAEQALAALEELPEAKDELAAYELLSDARAALARGEENKAKGKLALAAKYEETPSGRDAQRLAARLGR